jgi:two-component system cell cycle sensor histidine kinase/response regulator CckA
MSDGQNGAGLSPEKRNQMLASLVESSDDAILAKDPFGIIQTWNSGAERLYGYEAAEVIGRSAILLLPPERAAEEAGILERIRRGERVDHFETTRLRKDGTLISVSLTVSPIRDAAGAIVGASHIARNVTERTRLEAATAQLAAIVSSSEDAMISKSLDGVILTWNAGAERVYGYTAEEARFRHMSMLLPEDREDEENAILERIRRGERVDHFETVRRHKDGHLIDVSVTISPIRDNDGAVRGASHVARDITDRKKLQEQLLQTQKLESLGILAGGVAHDFNNILVGILANSSLLADSIAPENPYSEPLKEIASAAERAAGLTRQLLAYAGKGRFVIEDVNLSASIREIYALVKVTIPPSVQVRLELSDDLPLVEADVGQLQQVIMNLVINAAEAVGNKPGLIIITTGVHEVDEANAGDPWHKDGLSTGTYVSVEVRDSGCGMDEATLKRIFDPFFTTKFAGRGLGLAAVLGIVHGHKGALQVYSEPGMGSTFKLLFPAVAREARPAPAPRATSGALSGQGKVLIVDDEKIVRVAAGATLRRHGYEVLEAECGRQAIDIFGPNHSSIALVLLDLTMPGMTGEEVMRELQSIDRNVPVLLSSGFNEVEAVRRFIGKGLAGFIQKPYTSGALAAKVKAIIERANQPNTAVTQ